MTETVDDPAPVPLIQLALEPGNLFAAWDKVRKNAGMPGVDGQGIDEFAHNVFGRLLTLKHQVERKEYRPLSAVCLVRGANRLARRRAASDAPDLYLIQT